MAAGAGTVAAVGRVLPVLLAVAADVRPPKLEQRCGPGTTAATASPTGARGRETLGPGGSRRWRRWPGSLPVLRGAVRASCVFNLRSLARSTAHDAPAFGSPRSAVHFWIRKRYWIR